jgi:hypothetical protein
VLWKVRKLVVSGEYKNNSLPCTGSEPISDFLTDGSEVDDDFLVAKQGAFTSDLAKHLIVSSFQANVEAH